jgi:hypothetical protein
VPHPCNYKIHRPSQTQIHKPAAIHGLTSTKSPHRSIKSTM